MLRLYTFYLISVFISTTQAVPCASIEERFGQPLVPGEPKFDPLAPGQGWQVIKLENCWGMRFHPVTPGQDPRTVRITTTTWTANPQQVLSTIKNYGNGPETNIMLWFKPTTEALQYSGILTSFTTGLHVTPQWMQPKASTVVSIILPIPTTTLSYVNVPPENSEDADCRRVSAFGANGQISATDYAYANLGCLHFAIENKIKGWTEDRNRGDPSKTLGRSDGAWFAAETSNPDTCIVIDLTTFPGLLP